MAKKRELAESTAKSLRRGRRGKKAVPPPEESARQYQWVKIGPGGRIVIPAYMRKALGLEEGGYVRVQLDGEDLHVVAQDVALRRVQAFVAERASKDTRSWTDLLIEERRREFEREERGE